MQIVAIIAGVFTGVLTGLIPGIHVNTVTAILLVSSASLATLGIDYSVLLAFTCSLAVAHTFFDVIPGLFLGIPGDETYALLPGHRLVKKGEGIAAIRVSVLGSLCGLLVGLFVVWTLVGYSNPDDINVVQVAERFFTDWMFWLLAAVSLILIVTDHNIFWSAFVFLMSGGLGLAAFGSPLIAGGTEAPVNVLFPSLVGLFGIAGITYAIATSSQEFDNIKLNKAVSFSISRIFFPSLRGGMAGFIVGLLPGLGGANAATLLLLLENKLGKKGWGDDEDKAYLVTTSSLNTAEALFSIAALYLIEKSRSGASIAIDQILGGHIEKLDLEQIFLAMFISGMFSVLIIWVSGKRLADYVNKMHHIGLNWAVILFLVPLTYCLLGEGGLLILGCASIIGLLPLVTGIRRAQLMGFFLVPVMLLYSGHQSVFVEFLNIEGRQSPSLSMTTIGQIIWAIMLSLFISVVTYRVVSRIDQTQHILKSIILPSIAAATVAVVILSAGRTYFASGNKPAVFNAPDFLEGIVVNVNDGNTVDISAFGRRYRVCVDGIDCPVKTDMPKLSQARSEESADWLRKKLDGREISWKPTGVDHAGRLLAKIYIDGIEVSRDIKKIENEAMPLSQAISQIDKTLLVGPVSVISAKLFVARTGKRHLRLVVVQTRSIVSGIMYDGVWSDADLDALKAGKKVLLNTKISRFRGQPSLIVNRVIRQ